MQKLKLYTVDRNYINYLYQYDNRVMLSENERYRTERKYLGIVLTINNFFYFAPLSSPKDSDYIYVKGEKVIRKSGIPIIRLVKDKKQLLGKIKLSNMIPVPTGAFELYDIENEIDKKYRDLVSEEIICIRKNRELIVRNACVIYNQKIKNYKKINYLDSTVNFRLLETACKNYK